MSSQSDDVVNFLSEYPDQVRDTALALRKTILSSVTGATELLDRSGRVIGYGFGSGYKDLVCTIIPSKTGVKLGIVDGATMADPQHLLQGAGKRHRYAVLTTLADARKPEIESLLKTAAASWAAKNQGTKPTSVPPPTKRATKSRR